MAINTKSQRKNNNIKNEKKNQLMKKKQAFLYSDVVKKLMS
jgi:hypothetical protein